jgi:hypothetical protein
MAHCHVAEDQLNLALLDDAANTLNRPEGLVEVACAAGGNDNRVYADAGNLLSERASLEEDNEGCESFSIQSSD